jgi:hypothetical protein
MATVIAFPPHSPDRDQRPNRAFSKSTGVGCNWLACSAADGWIRQIVLSWCFLRQQQQQQQQQQVQTLLQNLRLPFLRLLQRSLLQPPANRFLLDRQIHALLLGWWSLNLRRDSCALDRLTAALTRFSRIVTVISLLLD